jgi:multidrug efflux pump subunit AcrA (membrane-fusion protein)
VLGRGYGLAFAPCETTETEVERAEAALALRTVKSPVAGVVVERVLSPGEFTRQGAIVKLAEINPLRVDVIAPVSWLGKVTVGMRARVVPDGPLRETLDAKVKVVDRVADAASGTFGIRLEVANPTYQQPAGLKCTIRFLD